MLSSSQQQELVTWSDRRLSSAMHIVINVIVVSIMTDVEPPSQMPLKKPLQTNTCLHPHKWEVRTTLQLLLNHYSLPYSPLQYCSTTSSLFYIHLSSEQHRPGLAYHCRNSQISNTPSLRASGISAEATPPWTTSWTQRRAATSTKGIPSYRLHVSVSTVCISDCMCASVWGSSRHTGTKKEAIAE